MRLKIPPKVSYILDILQRHGFEAYAVGGCVRDLILAREPDDFDITTSARPGQVKACFRRTVDTGIQHGTVTVMLEEDAYEVTTFRIDGDYSDGRHPDSVTYTGNLAEDLMRRDFTINAMAYNDTAGLVDLAGGMRDLQKKVIRCVGDPDRRFEEDALRVMRAVRFAAQLGFAIDRNTAEAVKRHAGNLSHVSAERIRVELQKLLLSGHPEMIEDLYRLGITGVVLPEYDDMMHTPCNMPGGICRTVGEHTTGTLKFVDADPVLRLAALLHESGRPAVRVTDEFGWDHFPEFEKESAAVSDAVLRRLKYDNATRRAVVNLVKCCALDPDTDAPSVRLGMYETGPEEFGRFLSLRYADLCAGKAGGDISADDPEIKKISNLYLRAQQIMRNRDPLSAGELAVNGDDLMAMGFRGKEIGSILAALLKEVLVNPSLNNREKLLSYAGQMKGRGL